MTTGMGSDLAGIVEREQWDQKMDTAIGAYRPWVETLIADRRALLGLLHEARNLLDRLRVIEAASREFRDAQDADTGHPGADAARIADAVDALRAALDPATTEPKEPE